MPKVIVLYHSAYGHVAAMADAVAEGARLAGAQVEIRRVPEDEGAQVARPGDAVCDVEELADFDAIVLGSGTRYGRLSGPMAAFLDQTGPLWMKGALNGKVGGAFASTGTQHGGQETTLFSLIANLMHLGLVVVGLDYGFQEQMGVDEVAGGSPYGATTIAGARGERAPSKTDLDGARYQGRRIAETAAAILG